MGRFAAWMQANGAVLREHFGVELFRGSLNIYVPDPPLLQMDLDAGKPTPSIVISHSDLTAMAPGLGDAQAWKCELRGEKLPVAV